MSPTKPKSALPEPPAFDELLAALQQPQAGDFESGFTSSELAKALGVCSSSIRPKLSLLIASGHLEVNRVRRPSIDGRMMRHSVYRLK